MSARQSRDVGQIVRDAQQQARDAQQLARDARQQVREAQQQVREAQQQVRDAEQQLREARTPDQRGAATQAMFGAHQALSAAEAALREVESQVGGAPVIWTGQSSVDLGQVIPPQVVDISIGLFVTCAVMVIGWPISRALGRRMDRRTTPEPIDARTTEQLQRIEYTIESMSIEIQRIAEGQRAMALTKQEKLISHSP